MTNFQTKSDQIFGSLNQDQQNAPGFRLNVQQHNKQTALEQQRLLGSVKQQIPKFTPNIVPRKSRMNEVLDKNKKLEPPFKEETKQSENQMKRSNKQKKEVIVRVKRKRSDAALDELCLYSSINFI